MRKERQRGRHSKAEITKAKMSSLFVFIQFLLTIKIFFIMTNSNISYLTVKIKEKLLLTVEDT